MSNAATALLAEVENHIPAGPMIVALSGGPDSAVLAWAATQVPRAGPIEAVHVDHGVEASPRLEAAARAVAALLSIPVRVISVQVPAGDSFENRAREVRLEALADAAGEERSVLLGHQRDDVAESVLLNLGRGAGGRGLSGIAYRRGAFVRPMLDVGRAQVRAVADELGLPYTDDPANLDHGHRRNAVRTRLMPEVEAVLGPGAAARIARAARLLASDDAALETRAEAVQIRDGHRGAIMLPAAPLTVLAPAVAARVVQRGFRRLRFPYGGTAEEVAAVLDVAHGKAERSGLGAGLLVDREGAMVAIYRPPALPPDPGGTELTADDPDPVTRGPVRIRARTGPKSSHIGRMAVQLGIEGPLLVRAAHEGERVDIGVGSKLVRDAMSESGIPRRLRAEWPVVAQDERIVWIAGSRLASWAGASPELPATVTLTMERIAL